MYISKEQGHMSRMARTMSMIVIDSTETPGTFNMHYNSQSARRGGSEGKERGNYM